MKYIGTNKVKLIASQAHIVNQYKNIRSKLLKCCVNIYFNRQCLHKKITPKYVNIKIANTSPASKATTKKAQIICIKEEIRFLFKKKGKLNHELYKVHLQAAQDWGKMWYLIQNSVQDSLNREMEKKYKTIDDNIKKLVHIHTERPDTKAQFYPRVGLECTFNGNNKCVRLQINILCMNYY